MVEVKTICRRKFKRNQQRTLLTAILILTDNCNPYNMVNICFKTVAKNIKTEGVYLSPVGEIVYVW